MTIRTIRKMYFKNYTKIEPQTKVSQVLRPAKDNISLESEGVYNVQYVVAKNVIFDKQKENFAPA